MRSHLSICSSNSPEAIVLSVPLCSVVSTSSESAELCDDELVSKVEPVTESRRYK